MDSQVLIYRDDGTTQPYQLKETGFELRSNGVAVVTFDSPKTLHALTIQRRIEMFLVLEHIDRCDKVKVVVWTASGTRAFCSGAPLKPDSESLLDPEIEKEYCKRGMAPHYGRDMALMRETLAFWNCKKPIIGAINGVAVGGGANIALANFFDIVFCSTNARFKYPFADLGLTPELGSSLVIPSIAGLPRAKELMFAGEWFSAQDALNWGLVNNIFSPEELMNKTLEFADKLAEKNLPQLILSKNLLNYELRRRLPDVLNRENETIIASLEIYGGREGLIKKMKKMMKSKM